MILTPPKGKNHSPINFHWISGNDFRLQVPVIVPVTLRQSNMAIFPAAKKSICGDIRALDDG
jgi:hypothetical protein